MPLGWLARGLRTGILTTRYPDGIEAMPRGWRGVVTLAAERCQPEGPRPPCVVACLPAALAVVVERADGTDGSTGTRRLWLDPIACIACARCLDACPQDALTMTSRFELAVRDRHRARLGSAAATTARTVDGEEDGR